METGREALILFYAFFWAAALAVTNKFQPFDTPSMCAGEKRAIHRFFVSLVILNLLPIVWLVILYQYLIPNDECLTSILSAAIASLSVFAFHRILHAILASEDTYRYFYTLAQVKEVHDRGAFRQPQTFWSHFVPGVLYIIIPSGIAWSIILFL
jgi:hypothetical protein